MLAVEWTIRGTTVNILRVAYHGPMGKEWLHVCYPERLLFAGAHHLGLARHVDYPTPLQLAIREIALPAMEAELQLFPEGELPSGHLVRAALLRDLWADYDEDERGND